MEPAFDCKKATSVIDIKAELLRFGLQPNEVVDELFNIQNPHDIKRTGNNGIFISIDGLDALVSTRHKCNSSSPYKIEKDPSGNYKLTKYDKTIDVSVAPIKFPEWASKEFQINGKKTNFSDYFLYEGSGFIHLAYNSCSFTEQEKCRFCSVRRRDKYEDHSVEDVCLALEAVLPDIPEDIHFCLGGGTHLSGDVEFFKPIIQTIRKYKNNPIWIEMIPPTKTHKTQKLTDNIQELINAGATSFGFNIEIWDDDKRKEICPGKSRVPKEDYLQACEYAKTKLGPDSVGSCLIVGLDTRENIKNAIDKLLELGVQPCILMYKDYDTDLGKHVIPESYQQDYIFLSEYAARKANNLGMEFDKNQGCLKCNCCTIMHDIQLQIKEKKR